MGLIFAEQDGTDYQNVLPIVCHMMTMLTDITLVPQMGLVYVGQGGLLSHIVTPTVSLEMTLMHITRVTKVATMSVAKTGMGYQTVPGFASLRCM